jgi:hypothetical protein
LIQLLNGAHIIRVKQVEKKALFAHLRKFSSGQKQEGALRTRGAFLPCSGTCNGAMPASIIAGDATVSWVVFQGARQVRVHRRN